MYRHNLTLACAWLPIALQTAAPAPAAPIPVAPAIERQDMRFCSRAARRAIEQFITDSSLYAPPYVPESLESIRCHTVVTLYREGRQIGVGSSGPGPIVTMTIEAAVAAARVAEKRLDRPLTVADVSAIEIEAIGDEVRVELPGKITEPRILDHLLEPAIDGLSARCSQSFTRVCPSELSFKNLTAVDALQSMSQSLPCALESQTLWRFRSIHWYQSAGDADTVPLQFGMTLVEPDAVTLAAVNHAIDAILENLLYRQQPSGLFAYEYEPAAYTYTPRDDPVHQAGAAWALAAAAASMGQSSVTEAADRALDALRARIVDLPGIDGAACVTSADDANKLGLTAQVALALREHPRHDQFARDCAKLTKGIVWLQLPTGEFATAFPPARRLVDGDVFPGLALSALQTQYAAQPDAEIAAVFEKAKNFYAASFAQTPSLRQAAWLAQPYAEMAEQSNRIDFARFAFTLADWIVDRQLSPEKSQWPELCGGIRDRDAQVPDIDTAVALMALVDAARAAKRFEDADRTARYRRAADQAARFVMQLQFRQPETFNLPIVRDVIGAVRTSPTDNRLRLENLQYAVISLINYRALAFPSTGGVTTGLK